MTSVESALLSRRRLRRGLRTYLQSLRNDKGLPEAPLPDVREISNPKEASKMEEKHST